MISIETRAVFCLQIERVYFVSWYVAVSVSVSVPVPPANDIILLNYNRSGKKSVKLIMITIIIIEWYLNGDKQKWKTVAHYDNN